jgi:hypothetical protein
MCMLIYQTTVEGILILNKRTSGVVIEVFPREGGRFIVELRARMYVCVCVCVCWLR